MAITMLDREYQKIVSDIIENSEFDKMKNIDHHGISRYEHLLKVSYHSYKIAKALRLDYQAVARGGLLHDFFISSNDKTHKESVKLTFTHPRLARNYAHDIFMTNMKEDDIIVSHMFPFYIKFPKYAESWVVNLTDKFIGTFEFVQKFDYKLSYAANILLLFALNYRK